ncbi:MAG: tRNA 2-selenouridine(34) synthase MnmH, partial [Cyanobacteria bacterium J069]
MTHALPLTDFLAAPGVLLDVRSPSEFGQGHIPGALSFPLFTDDERAQVGTCYKQQGRDAAVELGFALAGPKFAGFIAQAKALANGGPVRLHCWRGGMRSEAVAWVLGMGGLPVHTLAGGYKTFRRWALEAATLTRPILILGGMTGTGKTHILHALARRGEQVLDLEAIAHHRGSSFGMLGQPPQPSNEQFENEIAVQWASFDPLRPVWIEAESKRIGLCRVPEPLFCQMDQATVLELVRPKAERLDILVKDYGDFATEDLIAATERIRKRLGGLRTQAAIALLQERRLTEAFDLLLTYYDKTYTYDLARRTVPRHPLDATGLSDELCADRLLEMSRSLTASPTPPISPLLEAPANLCL